MCGFAASLLVACRLPGCSYPRFFLFGRFLGRLRCDSRKCGVGKTPLWKGTKDVVPQDLPVRVVRGEAAEVEARDVGVRAFRISVDPNAVREEVVTKGVRPEVFEHVRHHAMWWAANLA